jgi:hypothetical protein
MTRYYFDTRENDDFVSDDIGVELATFEQVKLAASQGMADFAKDVLPGSCRPYLIDRGSRFLEAFAPSSASL